MSRPKKDEGEALSNSVAVRLNPVLYLRLKYDSERKNQSAGGLIREILADYYAEKDRQAYLENMYVDEETEEFDDDLDKN